MGCDGGTIPRRDELVKVKKKPEAKDKDSELSFQWKHCCITQQVLKAPIVTCGLGRLYNKESLIEALINRDILPASAHHIKSLKDVKTLNLTLNPVYKITEKKEGELENQTAPYICPVIGLEMSGKFRFVALWSCGCVFSERALKEINTNVCHKCQKPFEQNDVVILNGNDDDIKLMRTKLEKRKLEMKKNKIKKEKIKEETQTSEVFDEKNEVKPSTSTSSSTMRQKRSGAVIGAAVDVRLKKIKSEYSVAKDPSVSDVYKSLFTTHKSEKEQNRAHWVTYNPFYN
ncbi:protein c20orf43 [Holotrichia oblita]|uniref:Protein c20orf43 n=1 Tax=Holotrichia oblita TaxID=644536 RepID=A0ACB9TR63_HOLOL|nr:protein c20orf43 [Holotrichia oblita]